MVGAGLNVFAVWNYIIANTHFGVIELNPKLLHAILGGELKEVEAALEFLSSPDPDSRSKEEGGKRIVREGQFQYRVVNWAAYQTMKNAEDMRRYNREKQAEYRARERDKLAAMTPVQREAYLAAKALGKAKVTKAPRLRAARLEGELAGRKEGVREGLAQGQAEVSAAPAGGNGSLPESPATVQPPVVDPNPAPQQPVSIEVALAAKREKDRLAREAAAALEVKGAVAPVTGSAL